MLIAIALVAAPALEVLAAPAAPTRISISATPRQVELVPGARATLRITAPEMPLLTVNVGQIEKLRSIGQGAFEATYLPPRETYPQVAIIVATSARGQGWLSLPLAGTGEVSVKADARGVATVSIGNQRFGPQRAGADGRALIRIVVPPGSREAVSGGKKMNLNTPDVSHVYVTSSRANVAADESAPLLVRAFAVTPQGKPRRSAPLELEASSGKLSVARETEPGVYESRWTLPPGVGAASVEARLTDEMASVSRTAVQRDPAKPRRLKLEVDRATVTAGEGTLDFSLSFEDGAGNPVDDVNPRATTSIGTFLGWTRGTPGRWMGHVSIPERLDGDNKLVIVASADDLLQRREVKLLPGPTAELTVNGGGGAGNGSPITLSVATLDRFGNPSDDSPPEARATLGKVDRPVRQRAGLYRVQYHPPASATAARDEITIRAGRAERVMRVPLRAPVDSRLAIAVKGGAAGRSGAFGPAAGAEAALWGLGSNRFGLVLEGTWFSFAQDNTLSTPSGPFALSSKASYLAFTGAPAWRQPLGRRTVLWASIGGGVVRAQSSSRLGGQPTIDEVRWVAAGTAAVSLGARMWGGYPFLEVRALYVGDPGLAGLSGSFTPIFLQLGYRFDAF